MVRVLAYAFAIEILIAPDSGDPLAAGYLNSRWTYVRAASSSHRSCLSAVGTPLEYGLFIDSKKSQNRQTSGDSYHDSENQSHSHFQFAKWLD